MSPNKSNCKTSFSNGSKFKIALIDRFDRTGLIHPSIMSLFSNKAINLIPKFIFFQCHQISRLEYPF